MTDITAALQESIVHALSGYYSHMDVRKCIDGVDARVAGAAPAGGPHSIHQIVQHMIFWQGFFLERLSGNPVPEPDADRWPWPAEPESPEEWHRVTATFLAGLDRATQFARGSDLMEPLAGAENTTRLEALRIVASHNSYHVGQIVLLKLPFQSNNDPL